MAPAVTTQADAVMEEVAKAHESIDWLTTEQKVQLGTFVQHMVAAVELSNMDHRIIEGDDEADIRGY